MSFTFCTHTGNRQIKLLCISTKLICRFSCLQITVCMNIPLIVLPVLLKQSFTSRWNSWENANNSRVFPKASSIWSHHVWMHKAASSSHSLRQNSTSYWLSKQNRHSGVCQFPQGLLSASLWWKRSPESCREGRILREFSLFYRTFQEESGQCHS